MTNLKKFLIRYWPYLIILLLTAVFFWKVFLLGQIPLPADLVVGAYYPWLDYKWGYPVGVPVKNPITSDVVSVIYPIRTLAVKLIKNGELPLWNAHMLTGYPLLANIQAAILSPTMIFYAFLSLNWGWTAQVIAQPVLAATFTYLFLRHLKLSKWASVLGGIFYAFSGFSLIWMEWNAHALVAAWVPLAFLFLNKILKEGKRIWAIGLGIIIALQFFSGYPQIMFYEAIALSLWILVNRKLLNLKKFSLLFFSAILGLALTSVQLFPAVELYLESQRVGEVLSYDLAYLPWQNFINFFIPDYFGNHATGNFWGEGNYTNNVGYSGLVVMILATVAAFRFKKESKIKYFIILLVLSLLLAFDTPLSFVFSKVLTLGAASNTRVLFLTNFSFAVLAAYALSSFQLEKFKPKLFTYLLPLLITTAIIAITFFKYRFLSSDVIEKDHLSVALRNSALPLLMSLAATSGVMLLGKIKTIRIRRTIIFGLSFLAVFELFRFGWKYTPFCESKLVFPETPVISYLESQDKPYRLLVGDVIPMNMWLPYGIESPSGYDAVYPKRWARFAAVSNSGLADTPMQGRYAAFELSTNPLTDIANGEYLMMLKPKEAMQKEEILFNPQLKKVFSDHSVDIYQNKSALPRAYFVTDWITETDENKILEKMLDPDFPYRSQIIIEENIESPKSGNANGIVSYLNYESSYSRISVKTDVPGLLFVSDAYYPGWKVLVDNQPGKILRANYTFRAVALKPGEHIVEFIYDPKSFRIGMWVTMCAFSVTVCLTLYEYISKRRLGLT